MTSKTRPIFIGNTSQKRNVHLTGGDWVQFFNEPYYRISHYDALQPFFMSLVSSCNHWIFIASTGGLSAGRTSAEHALFPYYTVDKLTENYENTGARALFLVDGAGKRSLWEPFSIRQQGVYNIERNLYKNIPGSALVFEEVNRDLELSFRYAWRSADRFGFVKTSWLMNQAADPCRVEVLDGLQNLLPANVSETTQNTFSPLLDAYKKAELDEGTGLAVYSLNSQLTDLAEPSESLLASAAWQVGLEAAGYLLCSQQLDDFRSGRPLRNETEIRGQRGAYFVRANLHLQPGEERTWHIVADVDQDAAALVRLTRWLQGDNGGLINSLKDDLAANTRNLESIVASADGLQLTGKPRVSAHHFANVMFNEMRGGYFPTQYTLQKSDFIDYVSHLNQRVLEEEQDFFTMLPAELSMQELCQCVETKGSADLKRLVNSYLPLSFSRRHGDPSRPWNRFSINVRREDGSVKLDYEGNWRDIFQNWEALAYAYPGYTENMIHVFLNATTADGYNPYRLTRRGIDWEIPDPGNPWANIGYWSDHQIIYLLKLMEISRKVHPGYLPGALGQPLFSYADVPYRIKPYTGVLQDPYNTITFDWEHEKLVKERVARLGGDGKLVSSQNVGAGGQIVHATLAEKLLTLLLAKLVNLVPDGGIWMNTQRPEWNDANNALVGKGLSVVTLAYLRRYIVFLHELFNESEAAQVQVHAEVGAYCDQVAKILNQFAPDLQGPFTNSRRRALMDALGQAGSDYRWRFYHDGFSGHIEVLDLKGLLEFLDMARCFVDHTLRANRRDDGLYHSYNILRLQPGSAALSPLYEMLEGQVAILSSGLLDGDESLLLLNSLRNGPLFRADQHSYILYPDRALKGFVAKNSLSAKQVEVLALVEELRKAGDERLFVRDENGDYHFAGHFRNIKDVRALLDDLQAQPRFKDLVARDSERIEALFEETFQHDQFTGRSGTFFAYEGLGSIYWHMVSKLLLAVQETIFRTRDGASTPGLIARYRDIRAGQCFNKTPLEYGAFPTDPYSHTPAGQGAKQPGMTGMVKEEILARQAELGFTIVNGCITFDFLLFDRSELLREASVFNYVDTMGQLGRMELKAGSLAYTICQVPIIYQASAPVAIQVHLNNRTVQESEGSVLDFASSRHIFARDGAVHHLVVSVPALDVSIQGNFYG